MHKKHNALVLSGGGARGAFQAGAMKALVELAVKNGVIAPFDVVSGVSAGAINATYYSAMCHHVELAMEALASFWCQLRTRDIFRTDLASLSKIGLRWTSDAFFGGLKKHPKAKALLDTAPLEALLKDKLPVKQIARNIKKGHLYALELTAFNYTSSESVSFVQAADQLVQWQRQKRRSVHTKIDIGHIMASAAIPLFFPPVKIGQHFYGDGCLRNTAPLSPAIRFGCQRLFIIGVRKQMETYDLEKEPPINASIARILSVLLNAVLLDATEVDLERLARINDVLKLIPGQNQAKSPMRVMDHVFIRPTEDIGALASTFVQKLPRSIRYLIDGLGSSGEASELISYLLFDPDYCRYLVEMGYRDTIKREDELSKLFAEEREEAALTV